MSLLDVKNIKVGSRRSELALIQTRLAINLLSERHPKTSYTVVEMSTTGDKILDISLSKIGDKSLFTKELELSLLSGEIDFIVHSLKDVPTTLPCGLVLGCIFNRVSPDDVVLMSPANRGLKLSQLPPGSVIGTSAVRRVATLANLYPHLKFVSVRGNLNTRLKKLDDPSDSQSYDAIILAKAGVERLGWNDRIDEVLTTSNYAVGQGALTCECRQNDKFILDLLSYIHEEPAALTSISERSLLKNLDGGCSTPIGVRSIVVPEVGFQPLLLTLHANVLSIDGTRCVEGSLTTELPYRMVTGNYSSGFMCHDDKGDGLNDDVLPPISSDAELDDARNPDSTFMGVAIVPSCVVARLRMARAQQLGSSLAARLLTSGAAELLGEIKCTSK